MKMNPKVVWALTHGTAGPRIDPHMFKDYLGGKLKVDEIHSTYDQCMHYTLIRFHERIRESDLAKFMAYAKDKYGIIRNNIPHYDSIQGNDEGQAILEGVVYQMIIKHQSEDNQAFSTRLETPGRKGGNILEVYMKKQISIAAGGTQARRGQPMVLENTGKFIWIEVLANIGAEYFSPGASGASRAEEEEEEEENVQDNTGKFIWIEVLATMADIFFGRCIGGFDS
jgi:hypothetical protein